MRGFFYAINLLENKNKKSFKHSLKLFVLRAGLEPARTLLFTGF